MSGLMYRRPTLGFFGRQRQPPAPCRGVGYLYYRVIHRIIVDYRNNNFSSFLANLEAIFWQNYAPSERANNFRTDHQHFRCLVDSCRLSQRKYRFKSGLNLRSCRKSGSQTMSQNCCLRGSLKSCEHDSVA